MEFIDQFINYRIICASLNVTHYEPFKNVSSPRETATIRTGEVEKRIEKSRELLLICTLPPPATRITGPCHTISQFKTESKIIIYTSYSEPSLKRQHLFPQTMATSVPTDVATVMNLLL